MNSRIRRRARLANVSHLSMYGPWFCCASFSCEGFGSTSTVDQPRAARLKEFEERNPSLAPTSTTVLENGRDVVEGKS